MIKGLKKMITVSSRTRQDEEDREKMASLERAEAELADLKDRSQRAISTLNNRHLRNHWQESIADMIRGAH